MNKSRPPQFFLQLCACIYDMIYTLRPLIRGLIELHALRIQIIEPRLSTLKYNAIFVETNIYILHLGLHIWVFRCAVISGNVLNILYKLSNSSRLFVLLDVSLERHDVKKTLNFGKRDKFELTSECIFTNRSVSQ